MLMKISVMFKSGRMWVCEAEAVGNGDEGEICAAAGAVKLTGGALAFEPTVMPWKDGK